MTHPFWTDFEELSTQDPRVPEAIGREPLLDAALQEWANAAPRDFNHRAVGDHASWRLAAKAFVEECLIWKTETGTSPQPVMRSRDVEDGIVREEWTIPVTPPLTAPATFQYPADQHGPFPGLLALHSMGSFRLFGREKSCGPDSGSVALREYRNTNYGGVAVGDEAVRQGYAVLCIDAMGFGERTREAVAMGDEFRDWRWTVPPAEAERFSYQAAQVDDPTLVRQVEAYGRSWAGLIVGDDIASLNFLASRPEVDATRLGCFGLSFGAARTNFLAALDDRIQAAASACWMSCLNDIIGYNTRGSLGWFLTAHPLFARIDLPDLAGLAAPRAFLAISGWDDLMLRTSGMKAAHERLRQVFQAAGCPENLGSRIFPGGHNLNRERQAVMFSFLANFLHPDQ